MCQYFQNLKRNFLQKKKNYIKKYNFFFLHRFFKLNKQREKFH